jgi:hypothetical protein
MVQSRVSSSSHRGRLSQTTRVVVALTSVSSLIPPELEFAPRFGPTDNANLSHYVTLGNRFSFSAEIVASTSSVISQDELMELTHLVQTHRRLLNTSPVVLPVDLGTRATSLLQDNFQGIDAVSKSREFCEELFLLRNIWGRNENAIPSSNTLVGHLLRTICLNACEIQNTDNRANALMLVAAADHEHFTNQTLDDVLEFLRHEHNASVISTIN